MPTWFVSGFSPVGLAAVLLQQLPGIVWALHPPKVDPFAGNSGSPLVESLEKAFGISTILLLVVVFVRIPVPSGLKAPALVAGLAVLAAYYVLYVLYYLGVTRWSVLLGMAAFPPLCFFLIALSQGNMLVLVTSVVFGAVHVGLTYANLGPGAGERTEHAA